MIQVQLYGEHFESLRLGFCYYGGVVALESAPERFFTYVSALASMGRSP